MNSRDDFPQSVKRSLADRAGHRCTVCGNLTTGPDGSSGRVASMGVACHINAAAPGGPRYDLDQTAEQRRSIENAIWCCANCARLVDGDQATHTTEQLRRHKAEHEEWIRRSLGRREGPDLVEVDGIHKADGVGNVTALDIEGGALIKPGTRSVATGIGNITATRIGGRRDRAGGGEGRTS